MTSKICHKCGQEKNIDEFSISNSNKDGRHNYCKSCDSDRWKEWYKNNKDVMASISKNWAKNNPEKVIAARIRYKDNHPEKAKQIARNNNAKRRAVKNKATMGLPWTHEQVAAEGNGYCPYCGVYISQVYNSLVMQIDHIIPLKRDGSDSRENVEAICCNCNNIKWMKTKEEILKYLLTPEYLRAILIVSDWR